MASLVQPLVGDAMVNGMALLSVGLVVYLLWLGLRERRRKIRSQRERESERQKHWGYV